MIAELAPPVVLSRLQGLDVAVPVEGAELSPPGVLRFFDFGKWGFGRRAGALSPVDFVIVNLLRCQNFAIFPKFIKQGFEFFGFCSLDAHLEIADEAAVGEVRAADERAVVRGLLEDVKLGMKEALEALRLR
ncbi:hypothetical protein D3C71_1458350 [compost metagenome]